MSRAVMKAHKLLRRTPEFQEQTYKKENPLRRRKVFYVHPEKNAV